MYCEKCKVEIRGRGAHCPLCCGQVVGESSDDIFPKQQPVRAGGKPLLKIMLLAMLVASVICVSINYSMTGSGQWSVFVVGGFLSFAISFWVLLKKKENIYKTILWQVVIIFVMAVLWDIFIGFSGWSIDFVIPITCTSALVAMAVIAQISHLEIEDYLIYLIIDAVFCILSLVLLLLDVTGVKLPSVICIGASVIFLGSLIIFEGRTLSAEIRRRMHL